MAIYLNSIDPAATPPADVSAPPAPPIITATVPGYSALADAPAAFTVPSPEQDAQALQDEANRKWFSKARGQQDAALHDPDSYFKGKDLGFAKDPARAKILALNDSEMELLSGREDIPLGESDVQRKLLRQQLAIQHFQGRGADSEEGFHAEALKAAQGRKDGHALEVTLETQAHQSAALDSIHEANPANWPATLAAIKAMPGYQSGKDPDYLRAFNERQQEIKDQMADYAGPLQKVWWAMKEHDPNGDHSAGNPDAGSVAREEYDNLDPADRPKFMDALGTLAKSMPQEKRTEFFRNLGMSSSRAPFDLANDASKFWEFMQAGPSTGGPVGSGAGGVVPTPDALARADRGRADALGRIDFAAEVRRIARDDFAPTAHVTKDGSWARTFENVAYGMPGLAAFTAEAAIPLVGPALVFSSMGGQAYGTVRDNLRAGGMEPEKASVLAAGLAPVVAIPQTILMHYVSSQWLGKLPVLNGVLTKLGDQIENRAVRFAMRAGTGALTGTAAMDAMNLVPSTVQDIGHALDSDIPDVQWTGKGGSFDAAFAGSLDTFLTMLPLSVFGAVGGLDAEARNRAFAEATPTQRAAFGITQEHSLNIYEAAAKGPSSLGSAVDAALQARDTNSPEAVAACEELKAQYHRQQAAQQQLQQLGISPPRLIYNPDGTVDVHDGVTGEHWGSAADTGGALRLIKERSTALDDLHADQIAAIGTMMEAARASVKLDPNSKMILELGKIITTANLGDLSPEAADRIAMQMTLEEQAQGGTGGVTRSVLGSSQSEIRNGIRETVNRIYSGGSILDVFHETSHGLMKQARDSGALTRADDIAILRALDAIYADKTTRAGRDAAGNVIGQGLRFVPEGMQDADIPEELLQEAKAKIIEMEILKTRRAGNGQPADRAATGYSVPVGKLGVPRSVISRNLAALVRLAPDATGRFKAFVDAFRTRWGISLARVVHLDKAAREGTFDKATYDTYVDKLLGIDQQKAHEAQVGEQASRLFELSPAPPVPDAGFTQIDFHSAEWRAMSFEQRSKYFDDREAASNLRAQAERERIFNLPADLPGDAIQFSLGPAEVAGILSGDALARIKDPLRRAQAMSRVSKNFQELQVSTERALLLAKSKRGKGDLKREAALQEELLADQYVGEAYARHQGILSNDDLTKIKQQPGHAFLADPDSHLRGRLMSKAAAIKQHPDMFVVNRPGDYDGADGIGRSVFGGQLMPDQAAQEMFDNHLIKSPTPDAMWALLAKEQSSVAKMKESLITANEDVRAAKIQAKTEANAWLAERVGDQEANFSQKEQILRSLAMMDAIMTALPPDLRGKLGGYTQMARIGTDETRLEYLREKLAKADSEMGKWLKGAFGKEFDELMNRSRPERDAEGKIPKGKIGASTHDLFRSIEESRWLDAPEVEEKIATLEKALERDDLTAEQEAHLQLEIGMTALAGDWRKATAARREQALLEAQRIYDGGYMRRKIEIAYEREDRDRNRATLKKDTGSPGDAAARDRKDLEATGLKGGWKETLLSFGSFEQVIHRVFGEDSATGQRLVDMERHADHAKSDSVHAKAEAFSALFRGLAGGSEVKGRQLQWKIQQKSMEIGGRQLSPMEMITATLMWRQEDGRRHMEGHLDDAGKPVGEWHYGQDFIDQIEAALTPEAKEVRQHLIDSYGSEYDRINSVFQKLYGVNMPRNPFYSPLTVAPAMEPASGREVTPEGGGSMSSAFPTPGSLRTRAQTAVAEPRFEDAGQVFMAHTRQMEHFIAYGEFCKEFSGMVGSRDVLNSVEASTGKQGRKILRDWAAFFSDGGNRDASSYLAFNQSLSRMAGRAASGILIGRASVIAVQACSLGGALAEMPAMAYLSRLAKLTTGNLGWGAALESPYVQRRLREVPVSIRLAMDGLRASEPTQLKYAVEKLGGLINGTDALMAAGTYAIIYDYQLGQAKHLGIENPEVYAHEAAERGCDRVSQPTRPGARSMIENRAASTLKFAWIFGSEARQKIALGAFNLANPKASAARKARAMAVVWIANGLVTALIRSTKRDLMDGDGEWFDKKSWNPMQIGLTAMTGPLSGVPILGDVLGAGIESASGGRPMQGGLLSGIVSAGKVVHQLPDIWAGHHDTKQLIKDVDDLLSGMAVGSDLMAEASSFAHLAKDLYGVGSNVIKSVK